MKRIVYFCLLFVLISFPGITKAEDVIRKFEVTAEVRTNREVVFEEKISYDFGDEEGRGIFRFIPEKYLINGVTYRLRYKVLEVLRDGNREPFEESSSEGNLYLKIGDADIFIKGIHEYTIKYSTDRVLNSFENHDELYWNVTGNEWQVPIEQASMVLVLPPATDSSLIKTACYTGYEGSNVSECEKVALPSNIGIKATRVLLSNEGLTAVFGLPKGVIKELTWSDKAWQLLADNGVLFFPLFAFIIMFYLWRRLGKDPAKDTVIPEYESPRGLTPAVLGAAMTDGKVPHQTVTATIIDLAYRGYMKIKIDEEKGLFGSIKQKFTFIRLNEDYSKLLNYEQELMRGLFVTSHERTMDDLRREAKFFKAVMNFNKNVQSEIDKLKIFDANPTRTRAMYFTVGGLVGFLILFFFAAMPLGIFASIVTGIIISIFGYFMPRRTAEGTRILADIEGFKWFLSVTEKDRMSFHNAPQRKPEQFQELLSYAIVFGVEADWAKQFESMQLPPPDWAEGTAVQHMTTTMLISNLLSMEKSFSSVSSPPTSHSSSGSSGFSSGSSGGGFGGGGGGRW